ncbi:MAG: SDR family oxidoreductase [Myxococcales bacterium]|nr:MAG: SDR family oxidoreductase [Myxococcales bacterium]
MRPPIEGCVLITGASSGIGRELARQVAGRCRALVLVARRRAELEELAGELRGLHPKLLIQLEVCDLVVDAEVEAMLASVERGVGAVDVLINNAGFGDLSLFDLSEAGRAARMIDLNVRVLTALTHRLVRPMVERQRGGILNVSSGFGMAFLPGLAVYIATKHYVTGFTEALRLDLEGTGVVVSQVCPGPVATEFADQAGNFTGMDTPAILTIGAEQCARETLAGFELGRAMIFPGFVNRLMMFFNNISPRFVRRLIGAAASPKLRAMQLAARSSGRP